MRTAKEIMTKDVITVSPDATVEELARILMEHRISGVPVVDDTKRMVGIITENDLIRKNTRFHIPTVINIFDNYIVLGSGKAEEEIKKMAATSVGDICTENVVSIQEDTSLEEIATIMAEQHVHLLPVLRDTELIGIVGKADVVKAMTHEATE